MQTMCCEKIEFYEMINRYYFYEPGIFFVLFKNYKLDS